VWLDVYAGTAEPSLWPAQLYATVYQQQFLKLTACIRLSASSKHICLPQCCPRDVAWYSGDSILVIQLLPNVLVPTVTRQLHTYNSSCLPTSTPCCQSHLCHNCSLSNGVVTVIVKVMTLGTCFRNWSSFYCYSNMCTVSLTRWGSWWMVQYCSSSYDMAGHISVLQHDMSRCLLSCAVSVTCMADTGQ